MGATGKVPVTSVVDDGNRVWAVRGNRGGVAVVSASLSRDGKTS